MRAGTSSPVRSSVTGEGGQMLRTAQLLKGLRIAFQRHRGGENARAATGALLVAPGMGRRIGAEEEFGMAGGDDGAQRFLVLAALGHGQAVEVGPYAPGQHVVAVDAQMVGGDGGGDVLAPGMRSRNTRSRSKMSMSAVVTSP